MRLFWFMAAVLISSTAIRAGDVQVVATELGSATPVEGVKVAWDGGEKEQQALTDAAGVATLHLTEAESQHVMIRLSKAGMVDLADYWNVEKPGDTVPAKWTFGLEPATRISGRVVDDGGRGVAGAHVLVHAVKDYKPLTQHARLANTEAITDATGTWTLGGVPARCDAIEIAAWHHEYLPDDGFYFETPFKPLEKLRDGSATFVLHAGTRLTGTVRDPGGKPVAGAEIYYNANRRVSNSFSPFKTGNDGSFVLGIAAGTTASLVVERKGFAPTLAIVRISTQPRSVDIVMRPPNVLTGRVIDGNGAGVAGATIWVHDWQGRDKLNEQLKTDTAGAFSWPDAPVETVKADVMAEGYAAVRDVEFKAGDANELKLVAPTKVSVTVLDAESGEPIKFSKVREGTVWHAGERLIWQGENFVRNLATTETGFIRSIDDPMAECTLRVEADGHYPADTPLFVPDGRPRQFTLRLARGKGLRGRLVMPDGAASGPGNVYLATDYLGIENGNVVRFPQLHAAVDADGHFELPPTQEKGRLIAITERGVGRWEPGQWESLESFDLQAWAQVSGRILIGRKPLADASLFGSEFADPTNTPPVVRFTYDIHTDADGRFKLDRVWPGRVLLTQSVPNHAPGRAWYPTTGWIDAKPGQRSDVQIGGTGRAIVGRLALASGETPWMLRVAEAKSSTDPDRPAYSPRIADDGQFRIEDLPAGDYTMKIALHEWPPDESCGWGRVVGEYKAAFTVPPVTDAAANATPIDLGTLSSRVRPTDTLKVGDTAPDFDLKTLDGKTVRLSHFEGKLVLLDFWASWCAPCIAELPHMKSLRDAHRNDPSFVVLGMNEDEETANLHAYLDSAKFDWPQALLGAESNIAKTYGATAIPATVLIGPDGKVIARDLRGDALRSAVDAALKNNDGPLRTIGH